jgi:hypothetical protein
VLTTNCLCKGVPVLGGRDRHAADAWPGCWQ